MKKIIFISGAVRSGKSRLAVELAKKSAKKIVFLATCKPLDKEMEIRVEKHKQSRPKNWKTIEEPVNAAKVIARAGKNEMIIFDCLTLWLTNVMLKFKKWPAIDGNVSEFIRSLENTKADVIIVSNEVGWGIVPENKLARDFRDRIGTLHQQLAALSNEVYLVIAGISQRLK
ncbi:MAG: bifunctional adenosylcobinamide kinase/adenosylcobinamide-phosphate guanylyltransferase [Candidatus Omnitrophica bacterium]|nr:bifunctional adenosylcobinamide kinase/adenosylcobinamide-phosphate guanylyltransferase [Candidatus Omnitrophota bacterium]